MFILSGLTHAIVVKITHIGLFGKFNDHSVADAIEVVKQFLQSKQLSVLLGNTTSSAIEGDRIDHRNRAIGDQIDLAIVVGGDGTLLHVARLLADQEVPAVGINLGRLGFLTDISFADLESGLEAILNGQYAIEKRTMLQCTAKRDGEVVFSGQALNEIVLSKGNTGRVIAFGIRVNGNYVSRIRGDGLILATPTGSTAYALSAGGPIIYPDLCVISMSPICPHTLSNRPIVLDENSIIEITAIETCESPANLALDGVLDYTVCGDETITISKAPEKLKMIRIEGFNYFETLYSKLGWQRQKTEVDA